MRTRITTLVLTALTSWVAAGAASGQAIQLVSQNRTVETTSTTYGNLWDQNQNPFFPDFDQPIFQQPYPTTDQATAADFLPWMTTAQTQDPPPPIVPPVSGTAQASQDSQATSMLLEASGSVDIQTDSYLMTVAQVQQIDALLNPPVPYFFGTVDDNQAARSHYAVTFDVATPTPYALTGTLVSNITPPALGSIPSDLRFQGLIELAESGGGVLERAEIDCFPEFCTLFDDSANLAGMLAPGTYVLSAEVDGFAAGYCYDAGTLTCFMPSGNASFAAQLILGGAAVPAMAAPATLGLAVLLAALGVAAARRIAPSDTIRAIQ